MRERLLDAEGDRGQKMKRLARLTLISCAAAATLAAQEALPATPAGNNEAGAASMGEAKPLIDALAAIGGIIAGADKPDSGQTKALTQGETAGGKAQPDGDTAAAANRRRSTKNSVILITGGAAAGAAMGQAVGRNAKSAIIGAAIGGAAGLIYDRLTYKNPKGI